MWYNIYNKYKGGVSMFKLILNDPDGHVMVECECGHPMYTDHDEYTPDSNSERVFLKDNHTIFCESCGKKHTSSDGALIKETLNVPIRYAPKCPHCNSYNLETVTFVKRLLTYSLLRVTPPYQHRCKSCGYKF